MKRGKDPRKGIENAEIDSIAYEIIMYDKLDVLNQWGENVCFSQWLGIIGELLGIIGELQGIM